MLRIDDLPDLLDQLRAIREALAPRRPAAARA
jgi:hypothetical protein